MHLFINKLDNYNVAPFYPGKRDEGWWCIVGDPKSNHLLAIKHITLQQKKKVTLEVVPQKVSSFSAIHDKYVINLGWRANLPPLPYV